VVGERQPYPAVDLGFVRRVAVFERLHDASHLSCENHDLLLGHTPAADWFLEPCFREGAPGLGLFHPARDEHRIGSRLERGAVLAKLGIALGDLLLCTLVRLRLVRPAGFELADSRRERDRVELAGQPRVEFRKQLLFAQVHGGRMARLVLRPRPRGAW
jgi:hypothetical protein